MSRGNVKLEFMPKGAKIGTGSLRRGAQIKAMLPDVEIVPLRGNIDTRLKKIETENLTGVILAAAGMKRLGYARTVSQYLPIELMLPAVGQGALGLQIRNSDNELANLCASLNAPVTSAEIRAERSYLRALGGGCRLPIAAYGLLEGQRLTLEGLVAAPDGSCVIRDKVWGAIDEAEEMGKRLAGHDHGKRRQKPAGSDLLKDGKKMKPGKVYIIGAGPGDPGLITLKAVECLRLADVVIYDNLVNEELLKYAQPGARFIYAGKKGGDHTLSQDKINALLAREALDGNTVARLKGGDPFIFGRGGEEIEVLAASGVPFEVIPGVTSAIAVPAYAGIPLTHRGLTSTVAFITGHEDPTKDKSDIDWQALVGIGTLVFLMGVKNLGQITEALISRGRLPDTPAALIRRGTTPQQEILVGTLATMVDLAAGQSFPTTGHPCRR